jgi:hypothetical protein
LLGRLDFVTGGDRVGQFLWSAPCLAVVRFHTMAVLLNWPSSSTRSGHVPQ